MYIYVYMNSWTTFGMCTHPPRQNNGALSALRLRGMH